MGDLVTQPVRLQLSRRKGFNLQIESLSTNGLNAVNCARPGVWGNVWKIGDRYFDCLVETNELAVKLFRKQYEAALSSKIEGVAETTRADLYKLRGKNLACWCSIDEPHCHVDVLLELANKCE